jgi:hypothetical protein
VSKATRLSLFNDGDVAVAKQRHAVEGSSARTQSCVVVKSIVSDSGV